MAANYKVITDDEAEERFGVSRHIAYPYKNFADQQEIRLYAGPVAIQGDFGTAADAEWSPFNVIVDGDLTVSGELEWQDYGAGCFLFVTGDVRARNVFLHGCPNVHVGGSLHAEHGVQGHHGDDGGQLTVAGETRAEVVINTLYFNMTLHGEVHAPIIGDPYRTNRPVDFDDEEADEVLVADALEPDGGIDEARVTGLLRQGRRILRPGVKSAHIALAERLAVLAEDPSAVTELDLSSSKLRAIPDLTAFPNLARLVLSHNPIREVPAAIGELTSLEELRLDNTEVEKLPREIAKLTKLRVLDLSSAALTSLPRELGELSALRVLRLARMDCPLPPTIGKLTGLEELVLSQHRADEQPLPFPAALTELTALRVLDLTGTAFREIPDSLTKLVALEELVLAGALGALTALPDLSKLPKLERLVMSGNRVLLYTPYPPHSLLDAVWAATSLEHLSLDRWSAQSDYNVESGEYEPVRPDLTELPAGVGKLTELRSIDLSFNGLVSLPDEFFQLPHLESVDLRYNPLSRETLDRIGAELGHVAFDLRHVDARSESSDDPNWVRVHELVSRADDAARAGQSGAQPKDSSAESPDETAIRLYEQALALCTQGARFSDQDQLGALYGLVGALDREAARFTGKAHRAVMDKLAVYARRALGLVPEDPAEIIHLTDEGAFQKEVIRRCGDALARHLAERNESREMLEEALNLAECAAACVEGESHFYAFATQSRILLALGRADEAYRIVERVLATRPGMQPFEDIRDSDEYQKWRAGQR